MNDQVDLIKQKTDIVELIGQRVVLKKAGRHYKGLCPFHSEKSPSFIVSAERQSYKCFGCAEGGDAISFLQKYEGMSFLEALEFLARQVGITLESYRPTSQDLAKKRLTELLALGAQYYHYLLTEHKIGEEAREYLKKRGIGSEARDLFNVGYAPNTWRGVSDYLVGKKGYAVEELEAVGLVIKGDKGGYYDRFRGRVMFPLRDHKGVVVGFSGRTLLKDEKEAKYINSPETALYSKGKMLYGLYENREQIRKADRIVVVEGELDMIPSWQAGIKEVVAIKGSAFTTEQARLIARFTKNVLFALDSDSAGQEAIKRAVKVADPYDLSIRVVQIIGGKDPGDVATENASTWREMVKSSVLFYDFLIDSACNRIDPTTGEGAKQISGAVLPVIAEIGNLIVKDKAVKKLASVLQIKEEIVYQEIIRVEKKNTIKILGEQVKNIEQSPTSRREKVEKYILAFLLQQPDLPKENIRDKVYELFATIAIAKIADRLMGFNQKFDIGIFIKDLPDELKPELDEAYLRDLSELKTPEMIEREYTQAVVELSAFALKEAMKKLTPQIADAEASGDKEKLVELQDEFVKLSKRLNSAIIPV
ncbi:MAG: DNA primase [bacterium]